MIVLPGGGCLFEITNSPFCSFVNVVLVGLALSDGETEKKRQTGRKIQSRTSPPNADSTGLCSVTFGWDYVDLRCGVLLRFTFLEGTEKIHMFVLPPQSYK